MKQWYVIHTLTCSEEIALKNLEAQGFDVFLPKYHRLRRHARKADVVQAPLFPRYLFIALDLEKERWLHVNSTRGVSYIVRQSGSPASVPENVVEELKARADIGAVVPLSSLEIFQKGTKLEILDGAFAGQTGVYERMTDHERVGILLHLLGRDVRIGVPVYSVAEAQ